MCDPPQDVEGTLLRPLMRWNGNVKNNWHDNFDTDKHEAYDQDFGSVPSPCLTTLIIIWCGHKLDKCRHIFVT